MATCCSFSYLLLIVPKMMLIASFTLWCHSDLSKRSQKSRAFLSYDWLNSFCFSVSPPPCGNVYFSLYLFFFVNLQFSKHVMKLLRGLSCGLLYTGTKNTEQMSVCTFCPKATLVHNENHGTQFFVLEGRTYSDVWPLLYLCLSYKCPPSISFHVPLKKALIYWPHSIFGH